MAATLGVHQIAQIGEIVLQHVGRAEPGQGLDHVIGVAKPAVAVVPVAAGLRMLGDGGGQRRDDGAGLLVGAQLERDGRTDHRLLPFQRHRQGAHPGAPVVGGLGQHPRGGGAHIGVEAFVRPQEEGDRLLQPEEPLLGDVADRAVGGQAHGHRAAHIADVVGAGGPAGGALAPVHRRPQADADARRAGDGPDQPDEGRGPVDPAELQVARAEVDDLQHVAALGGQLGAHDGGVAQIGLADVAQLLGLDGPETLDVLGGRIAVAQQGRKEGIAIHAGDAAPHQTALPVDQGAGRAVADREQIQRLKRPAHPIILAPPPCRIASLPFFQWRLNALC